MAPSRRPRPIRLHCELLEDRRLPATKLLASLAPDDYRADQILVQFKPGTTPQAEAGTSLGAPLTLVPGLYEVHLAPGISVAQALDQYQSNPNVALVQPDYFVAAERVPNDPLYRNQWPYNNPFNQASTIKATAAWDTTVGSGQSIVAVIDTGIDLAHPDLAANLWRNAGEVPGNNVDDDGNGFIDDIHGYNFVRNTGSPVDDNGHGTHVAGILGAVGNNGLGVAGLAWNVKIMALKFMDASGRGATSAALRALNYAVQMGATISNNSWTSSAADSVLETGIRNAQAAGHIYVAAAGNTATNLDVRKIYPAGFTPDNIVAVAALDSSNRLASWSNWGPNTVDIAAPGSGIYSTLRGNRYGTMSGTSMATPFVAATLALVRELHPTWTYRQVIDQVLNSADRLTTLNGKVASGKLNVAAALGQGTPPPPPPPVVDTSGARVTNLATLVANNQLVGLRVTFNEPIQANTFTTADVLTLTGPGGALTPSAVSPVSGSTTQFDVLFAGQSSTGNYSLTLGTDIRDAAGNAQNQNGNAVNGETPADRYAATVAYTNATRYEATGLPAPLLDWGTASFPLTIPDSLAIGAVRVQLNINHAWMSDLVIKLRSPAGTEVLLINRRGGGGRGFANTTLDDHAALAISQGGGLFTGTFRPEAPLSAFAGQRTNGTWTLTIQDKAGGASGTLLSWSLAFDQAAGSASLPRDAKAGTDVVQQLLRRIKPVDMPLPSTLHTIPKSSIAPRLNLTPQSPIRTEQIRHQAQQLLAAWQKSMTTATPLLNQLRAHFSPPFQGGVGGGVSNLSIS
jgi:subtilisin family serine protease